MNDRLRDKQNRKTKRVILVSFEGKNKTENIYLNNYANRDNNYNIKIVYGNETDPINLVNQTIKKIKDLELDLTYDVAYCIFDTDVDKNKEKSIEEAISIANENNIIPIISNPCVEIWFLLHYEYTTSKMNNNEVINRLKRYNSHYKKSYNIYKDIELKTEIAIKNAKKLEKEHIKNNIKLQSLESNPYTEIYKVVEELKKK